MEMETDIETMQPKNKEARKARKRPSVDSLEETPRSMRKHNILLC